MLDQHCRRSALQQRYHARERNLRLPVVGQQHTEKVREIGHEGQVVDEKRQVSHAETRAPQRLRRQDQD